VGEQRALLGRESVGLGGEMAFARAGRNGGAVGALLGILTVCMVGTTLGQAATIAYRPVETGAVTAVFPPWWGDERVLVAAGSAGTIQGVGRLRTVLFLRSSGPGLSQRTRDAGALFVFAGSAFGLCGTSGEQ
jgi:hypothetical protein